MRFSILFGCFFIGNAIYPKMDLRDSTINIMAIILLILFAMDIIELYKKLEK